MAKTAPHPASSHLNGKHTSTYDNNARSSFSILRLAICIGLTACLSSAATFLLSTTNGSSLSSNVSVPADVAFGAPESSSSFGGTASSSSSSSSSWMSMEPNKRSLHPKWKLWEEMTTEEERQSALDEVGRYMEKYGKLIMPVPQRRKKIKHGDCELIPFKNGHSLCGPRPSNDTGCSFVSFGINDDPSFDVELGESWGCRGFAGDPTVDHPSRLHPRVTFHNVGATMLRANEERDINKGGEEDWVTTSMPKLRFWLGWDHLDIVKMDCEGCEVAFARDIIREDPTYLHHVDQISIETHVSKAWIQSKEDVYYFGLHFALLEEAGFVLEWSEVFGCSKRHEVPGCMEEMDKYGFPCGYKPWPGKTVVVIGWSCQDFLWKRYTK